MRIINTFLAGLVAGLLFAPQSGKRTREKIANIFDGEENKTSKPRFPNSHEVLHDAYENIELGNKRIVEPSDYAPQ
jgi:gas vesicle protein